MEIIFKQVIWGQLKITLELGSTPTPDEELYIKQVLDSWYTLGLLGGFNASSTPLQDSDNLSLSSFSYVPRDERLPSLMHNMGEVEFDDYQAACWFDLGTADALALDILINALETLSRDYVPLTKIIIGNTAGTQHQDN